MRNYRPIAVIPTLSKPIEAAFKNQLLHYMEHAVLMAEAQHGFRYNRSTIVPEHFQAKYN